MSSLFFKTELIKYKFLYIPAYSSWDSLMYYRYFLFHLQSSALTCKCELKCVHQCYDCTIVMKMK